MTTYVLLIKFSSELAKNYSAMQEMGKVMREKYMKACAGIKLSDHHYWLSGPYDFMHVYDSPDVQTAFTMAACILSSGMAERVETWPALNFQQFMEAVKDV